MKQNLINVSLLTFGLLMNGSSCKTANADDPKEVIGETDAVEADNQDMDLLSGSDSLDSGVQMQDMDSGDSMDSPDPDDSGSDDNDTPNPGDSDDYDPPSDDGDADPNPEY